MNHPFRSLFFCGLVSCLGFFSYPVIAQRPHRIDSLLSLIAKEKEDTLKAKHLNLISGDYTFDFAEYDSGFQYAQQAYLLSNKLNFKKGIAESFNNFGAVYFRRGNYQRALENFSSSLAIRTELGDKKGMYKGYNNVANCYNMSGNLPEALKNYIEALRLSEEIHDKAGIAMSNNNMGTIYQAMGNQDEALKSYSAALRIKEEIGDKLGMAIAQSHIVNIYAEQGKYDESLKMQFKALKIMEEIGNQEGIASSLNTRANIYQSQEKYDEALKNHLQSLEINQEIGDDHGVAYSLMNVGSDYFAMKDYANALVYFDSSLSLARKVKNIELLMDGYSNLGSEYAKMNNYKKAYEYHQLYSDIKDSLLNAENSRQIAQMKEQYESEKKDAEISLLHKDNKLQIEQAYTQRIIMNVFIIGFALLLSIAFLFVNRLRLQQTLKMQLIRNKIAGDLHDDIGSTLSSIAIYSELANEEVKDKSTKASSLLQTINENSRSTIESMSDIVWAINPKNDRFENILQRMRTFASGILEAKNIDLKFDASPSLPGLKLSMEKRKNLYLILKEAVNNVAKYSSCKTCTIKLWLEGKILNMKIEDDGVGFDLNDYSAGNGLANMKRRSEEMKGKLDISSMKEKGTAIQLSFPAT